MTRIPRLLLLIVLTSTLSLACENGDDDDDGPPGPQGDDDDDDTTAPDPETACQDGQDNDEDGLTDCDDPDCDAVTECTWPTQMDHRSSFAFTSEIGMVDDCETIYTSLLNEAVVLEPCPVCDRTYEGAFNYTVNSCEDILDFLGMDIPDEGGYGVIFISDQQWEIYSRDEDLQWYSAGIAEYNAQQDHYQLQRVDDIQSVGYITITLTYTDLD